METSRSTLDCDFSHEVLNNLTFESNESNLKIRHLQGHLQIRQYNHNDDSNNSNLQRTETWLGFCIWNPENTLRYITMGPTTGKMVGGSSLVSACEIVLRSSTISQAETN